ncbi:hypothetical protein GQ54DRAFT_325403 [Martensiomyces pterosporus]|nr:hypothetical protein GQ54DRAFT_325403 [Martensiomyces pterosporus]
MQTTRVTLAALVAYVRLSLALAGSAGGIRGLDPALADKYRPNAHGNFACLDGSAEIPFARVNDDYCDCPDGSDEPGTSACNNGSFYCANAGHIPARIDSSKVNDGICDEQCCDGSDEWDSDARCANRCEEIGQRHREKQAEIEAAASAGGKRRTELVREASGMRKKKREELGRKEIKLKEAEQKLAEAEAQKNELEEKERKMREDNDKDRESRKQAVYDEYLEDLVTYRSAIGILDGERETLKDDIEMFYGLLVKLRDGYNKNYHDLAVKAAVVGLGEYEQLRRKEMNEIDEKSVALGIDSTRRRVEEAKTRLDAILDEIAATSANEDETTKDGPQTEQQELEKQLESARSAYWEAQNEKNTLSSDVSNLRELLEKDLGPQDVYLTLKDECFALNAGEYTYEICLLDRATQISNKDNSRQNLGSFTEFGTATEVNSDGSETLVTDYTVHKYLHGTKCWNGPNRSLIASFECAEDIRVLSVTEPEKCEYHAKVTGPFACPLAEEDGKPAKDEETAAAGAPPPVQAPSAPAAAPAADDVEQDERGHDEL